MIAGVIDLNRSHTSSVVVRDERPGDIPAVYAVHASSFPAPLEARLVDALRSAGRLSISLVAEIDGAVAGHVGFSPVTIDGDAAGLGLAPLAVLEAHRRAGVGAQLVERGLDACRRFGCGLVVLLGDPKYYGRFGFEPASRWGLRDEYGGGDAFQAIELRPGAAGRGGVIRYSSEFDALT
jgi:putative acetyltransferase